MCAAPRGGGASRHPSVPRFYSHKQAGELVTFLGDPVWLYTHWTGSGTKPCLGDGCHLCQQGLESRLSGYAPATRLHDSGGQKFLENVVHSVTPRQWDKCFGCGPLRGKEYKCESRRGGTNTRMHATYIRTNVRPAPWFDVREAAHATWFPNPNTRAAMAARVQWFDQLPSDDIAPDLPPVPAVVINPPVTPPPAPAVDPAEEKKKAEALAELRKRLGKSDEPKAESYTSRAAQVEAAEAAKAGAWKKKPAPAPAPELYVPTMDELMAKFQAEQAAKAKGGAA